MVTGCLQTLVIAREGILASASASTIVAVAPPDKVHDCRGRFDFTIDYVYYRDGDRDLWLGPETGRVILKNG